VASEPNARDAKLIQYLNEAYGKEKELEQSLTAHIAMTDPKPYKKRLQDHLRITKAQAKGLERRIKQLGGKAEASNLPGPAADVANVAQNVANRAVATAKGGVHALRGTGESEKLLKNAKTELWNENEEIGNYLAIESLAESVGDKETAKLAKEYRKQEEQMAKFLQGLIPRLSKSVAREEIPAAERRSSSTRRRSSSRSSSSRRTSSRSSASSSRSASSRSSSSRSSSSRSAPSKRSTAASKGAAKRGARKTASSARSTASSARKTASSARKTASSAGKTAASGGRAAAKTVRRSASSTRGSKKS
jgi:ferritin-like metal-binding protein YciE